MALIPARVKYRRVHRLPYEGHAKGNTELSFGEYGLVSRDGAWINANQIEAARVAMTRFMKRGGKVWINIFPHMPRTAKPIGVKEGKIMFEIGGVDEATAREAFRLASHKLPVRTKFIKKENGGDVNEG